MGGEGPPPQPGQAGGAKHHQLGQAGGGPSPPTSFCTLQWAKKIENVGKGARKKIMIFQISILVIFEKSAKSILKVKEGSVKFRKVRKKSNFEKVPTEIGSKILVQGADFLSKM